MSWEVTVLKTMRFILQGLGLFLGGGSMFLVWASFYDGRLGSFAFVTLATAAAIALGTAEIPAARPRTRR
jgi:hypothetical protein